MTAVQTSELRIANCELYGAIPNSQFAIRNSPCGDIAYTGEQA
jgi:hypothetical protein